MVHASVWSTGGDKARLSTMTNRPFQLVVNIWANPTAGQKSPPRAGPVVRTTCRHDCADERNTSRTPDDSKGAGNLSQSCKYDANINLELSGDTCMSFQGHTCILEFCSQLHDRHPMCLAHLTKNTLRGKLTWADHLCIWPWTLPIINWSVTTG